MNGVGVDFVQLRRRDRLSVAAPLSREHERLKSFLMRRCHPPLSELDAEVAIELSRGALRLPRQIISVAGVERYRGREVGDAERPDKVYQILRSPQALAAAAAGAAPGLRVFDGHVAGDFDDDIQIGDALAGCLEGGVSFDGRYLRGNVIINRPSAIQKIKAGALKAFSISYRILGIDLDAPGTFEGEAYNGVISDLELLDVSLVDHSRCRATEIIPTENGVDR